MKRMLAAALIVAASLFLLSEPHVLAGPLAGIPCSGDFNYDGNVDGGDVGEFLIHFGRSVYNDPCPPLMYAPVEKSGQTTSYATGDDGDLEKGVIWPNPRFTDNSDGTVTDNLTNLIWMKNANCFGSRIWDDALWDCNLLASGQCGLTDGSNAGDWRLPNRREIFSLTHDEYSNPALSNTAGTGQWSEGDPFNNVQSYYYWSSSTYAYGSGHAWHVHMINGAVGSGNKDGNFVYVWPVRDPL